MSNQLIINRLNNSINSSKSDIQLVADLFGIKNNDNDELTCKSIIKYLKSIKKTNPYVKYLLDSIPNDELQCTTLILSLKDLINPSKILPNLPPFIISDDYYNELIQKYKDETITLKEKTILDKALHTKYCYCAKNIYIRNLWDKTFNLDKKTYNPYSVCIQSIYNNRNIEVPSNLTKSCKNKYSSYKSISKPNKN
jgi:hypothetical protein